jgi:hypothetical protein
MAEPCETPELPAPPVEQAKATGASIKTKDEVMRRQERETESFDLIDIPKR